MNVPNIQINLTEKKSPTPAHLLGAAAALRRMTFWRRAPSALRLTALALVCAGTMSKTFAKGPTAENLSVDASVGLGTPIVLQGSGANGETLTFKVVSVPSHGSLSGTGPNLTYQAGFSYLGPDS